MSLIHWWPLNSDTQDRITNTKLTNNGATIISNGKTGQCYTFNGSTNLTVPYSSLNTLGSNPAQFSFAFWIKLNSTWTGWGQVFTIGRNGSSWTDIRIGFDVASDKTGYFTISDGTTTTSYGGPKHILTIGKWHHIAATFDNKEMKLFIDGQPASTPRATASVLPSLSSDTIIAIGGNSGEKGECDINDVRIYDHALSQAEVKELSKALVVHYTFNDVCAEPTTNVSTINGWSSYTSYFVISERTETGLKVYRPTNSTNTVLALSNSAVTGKMAAGEIWTFSCYLYVDGKPYKCTQPDMSTYKYSGINYYSNDDGYYTCTFTVETPEAWIIHAPMFGSVGTNVMCEIDKIQFEKKDHATPYTPTNRESMLVNEAGYDNPTVKNLTLSKNTVSGTYSGVFNASKPTQIVAPLELAGSTDVTVACWLYSDGSYAFGDKALYNVINGTEIQLYAYGRSTSWLNTPNVLPAKTWTHVAITYSAITRTLYINGQYKNSDTISGTFPSGYGELAIGYGVTTTRSFNGNIADFRVYRTCLSALDIQNLYESKAYITDKGDIMCGEFNSKSAEAQITSKYEVKCTGIVENSADYNMLDYINFSTAAPGIDTGVAPGRNLVFDTTISNIGGGNPYIITQGNYGLRVGGSQFVNFVSGKRFRSSKNISQKHSIQGSDSYLVVSGSLATQESDNDSPSGNVILFKNQGNNVTSGYLYNCTLMNQDKVVRDFIPVQRKSDNAIGLLDLIENKFYTCSGISAGPLKASNEASIYNDGHISGREIIEI